MNRKFSLILLLAAIPVMAGQASAQNQDPAKAAPAQVDLAQDGTRTTIGLGIGVTPDYEGSNDYEAVPIPWLEVVFENNMSISIVGSQGRVDLIPDKNWKGGLAFDVIPERSDVDNDAVDAMRDIDTALMVGGFLGYNWEHWRASVEAMKNTSDSDGGNIIRLTGGYKFATNSDCRTSINAFTTWADNDYMETYFGVTNSDAARSGLSPYKAEEGFKDIGVAINSIWKASDQWSVFSMVGYKLLLEDADDSPIVDQGDSNQFFGGVGLTYRF